MHHLPAWLLVASMLLVYLNLTEHGKQLVKKMLWRMRWLWISIFFVMALNTPGEYVMDWPWLFTPTYEGLLQGIWQIGRLGLMVLLIAWMSCSLNRQQLLTAFYTASQPVRLFCVSPQRLAARLWLTLGYIEHFDQTHAKKSLIRQFFASGDFQTKSSAHTHVVLSQAKLSPLDIAIIGLMLFAILCSQVGI